MKRQQDGPLAGHIADGRGHDALMGCCPVVDLGWIISVGDLPAEDAARVRAAVEAAIEPALVALHAAGIGAYIDRTGR